MNASLAPALPSLLYRTAVFEPGTTTLPTMLPMILPRKNGAVILPPLEIVPVVFTLPVTLNKLTVGSKIKLAVAPNC